MTQMSLATGAQNFNAKHSVAQVLVVGDILLCEWLKETRPSGSRIEFGIRGEEREIAAHAGVNAGFFVIVKNTAESAFRPFAAGNLVLLGCKLLAPGFDGLNDPIH